MRIFFGALDRGADAAPFPPVLAQALREPDGRLAITVLDTPHERFVPSAGYPTYRAEMAGCELAFLPFADNRFNRLKSDLKAVEAGAHRLCCLAGPNAARRIAEAAREWMRASPGRWCMPPDRGQTSPPFTCSTWPVM